MVRNVVVFALLGASHGLATRKPASLDDLQAIAQSSEQIAKRYLEIAQSQPTVEDALRSQREADAKQLGLLHKAWYAELASDADSPCENCGTQVSASFIALPSATVHLPEPDESLSREISLTDNALADALAALESEQDSTEAMLQAAF